MLFHIFDSQKERIRCGGSAFAEMQFCRLAAGTKIESLLAVDNIKHWQDDSLYISDENLFYKEYSGIFDCGIYNNLKSGAVDLYGINYYPADMTDTVIKRICEKQPDSYEVLINWLTKAKMYNGFYILGL